MYKYSRAVLLVLFPVLFCHCDPCLSERACADSFAFKLVDKASRQDIVFATPSIYNRDSVYLLTTLPGYIGSIAMVDNNRFKSRLLIPTDTLYLRLTSTDTDTLLMKYDYEQTKCCNMNPRGFGKLQSIRYNGLNATKEGETFVFEK